MSLKHISEVLASSLESLAQACLERAQTATDQQYQQQQVLSAQRFLVLSDYCAEVNRQREKVAEERRVCATDIRRHIGTLTDDLRQETDQARRDDLLRDIQALNEARVRLTGHSPAPYRSRLEHAIPRGDR